MESWVCIYSLVFEHLTANQDILSLNLLFPLFMNFLAITFLKNFFQTKSFAGLLLLFFRLIFSGLFRFSNKMFRFSYFESGMIVWGCSSVVEHSTADREVPGSTPGPPLGYGMEKIFLDYYLSFFFTAKTLKTCTAWESNPGLKNGNLEWYHYTSSAFWHEWKMSKLIEKSWFCAL